MKIETIFEQVLYACRFKGEAVNEFYKCLELWTDVGNLYDFAKRNNVRDNYNFIEQILTDVSEIQELITQIYETKESFEKYFHPLQSNENNKKLLSFRKGKYKTNQLRFYAIRIGKT